MAEQKKVRPKEKPGRLEEQHEDLLRMASHLPVILPHPESMSLEQPSPFRVVPMTSADTASGEVVVLSDA